MGKTERDEEEEEEEEGRHRLITIITCPSAFAHKAVKWRPLHCLPLKLTCFCLCFVFMWEESSSAKFFFLSVCLCLSATRGAVFVIVFMLIMWTPRGALSVTTCPVNMCVYIYFVNSYDHRMIGQLDPGWADDVTLALKHWCFCHQTRTSKTWIC